MRVVLLAIVIVAFCFAQLAAIRRVQEANVVSERLMAENAKLMAENAELRTEAGYLNIEDPNKVCVLQLPSLDDLTWRCKVYLPAGNWAFARRELGIV